MNNQLQQQSTNSFQTFSFQQQQQYNNNNQFNANSNNNGFNSNAPLQPQPQHQQQHQQLNNSMDGTVPQLTKDKIHILYKRWQALKAELGENATSNNEFVELSKVLRGVSRQQELLRQKMNQQKLQQQQQQQRQSSTSSIASSGSDSMLQSMMSKPSPMPTPASPQYASPAPTSMPQLPTNSSPFTAEQLLMFRHQMIAFKALSRNEQMPPAVQKALFSRPSESVVSKPSPQSPYQPQQNNDHNSPLSFQRPISRSPSISSPVTGKVASQTTLQKLGVPLGFVDPYSLLPSKITFDDFTKRQQSLLVPSISPIGFDVNSMKLERERQIKQKIGQRISELCRIEQNLSDDVDSLSEEEINRLIELKSLKLLNYHKALRGDLLSTIYYVNSVALDETNKVHFSRMKKLQLGEVYMTENFDNHQRHERAKRENQKKEDFLNGICGHARSVKQARINRKSKFVKLGRAVQTYHTFTEREEQKRVERTAKQRLQALRANDEEAYIKLLDQTKDTRITHLLRQTNQFLDSLADAVRTQQLENRQAAGKLEEIDEDQDLDEEREKVDYYAVAHQIKEEVTKQPNILVGGTLKEYQIKGLQWMVSLFNNNLNGILADEMGLGKTIQTISLVTYLIETKNHPGPYLVIVPLSTLTNWTLEFEKWAPSVKKVVYKGNPMARKAQQAQIRSGDFQVLLTTYEYIIKDRPVLSRIRWVHMIIDEGHRMKNSQSKLSSTLTQYYNSKYRLILTGTPLQNNLPELWALLNFVLPKIFNSVKSFDEWFNTPFANTGGQDKMDLSEEETLLIIRRLHKVLRPFLLRRLKKDVEKDLPDKVERVIKCKMSALQSKLYQQMLKHRVLFLGENAQGASSSGLKGLNNQIMQLRKICNHPFVFEEVENLVNPERTTNDDLWRAAGKFELLDRILPKFKATGHRVLLFFQMTQIMDIMEDFLRLRGMSYLRLDGATKAEDRSELLKMFNAPHSPYFAFLLSTRAGGLGLNLQTADTVIIYDTDWNPHQDLQAQDRAHRIGQTKEVRILRLITEDSVEENILERAHKKLDIDGKVIQAGKFDNKSTAEEQEAFLRSLLEAEEAKRSQNDDEDEELDDEELNEILARNDDEQELFKSMDKERIANDIYSKGKHPKKLERLIGEDELPEVYKQDITEHMKPEPMEYYGRGARERKVTHYDDGLTEEQWLDAVDNDEDSIEDAIARKRARITKRKHNKLLKDSNNNDSSPQSEAGSPSTPSSPQVGGVKRKRGRRTKAEMQAAQVAAAQARASVTVAAAAALNGNSLTVARTAFEDIEIPPRKKAKGRPPKVKETLSPAAREDLTIKMEALVDHLMTVQDDSGRNRIDLFLELPAKRIYPDYYLLIQSPIAIDMISKRIKNATYQKIEEFLADFKLMFANARVYNEEGSFVYDDANELEKALNLKLEELIPGSVKKKDYQEDEEALQDGISQDIDEDNANSLVLGEPELSNGNNNDLDKDEDMDFNFDPAGSEFVDDFVDNDNDDDDRLQF